MRVIRYDSRQELDTALWQRATKGHPFVDSSWFDFDATMSDNAPTIYIVVCDGGSPVGAATFQILREEEIPNENKVLKSLFARYLQARPLVVARSSVGTSHSSLCLPDDPAKRDAVLNVIQAVGKELLKEYRGSFLIFDYLEEADLDLPVWKRHEYLQLYDFMNLGTQMHVADLDTFDDYKQTVRARSKRAYKDISRHIRKAQGIGASIEFRPTLPAEHIPRARQLMDEMRLKFDEIFEEEDLAYEKKLIDLANRDEHCHWQLGWKDGRLVVCELLIHDPNSGVVIQSMFGRDTSVDWVYFYSYYETIRYAIETLNATQFIGNEGAEQFKFKIGFSPDIRNNFAVYVASPVARMIASVIMRFYEEH